MTTAARVRRSYQQSRSRSTVRALLVARALDAEARTEEFFDRGGGVSAEFGPQDLPATAEPEREALRAAERQLVELEALRDSMREAAFNVALEAQDAVVTRARGLGRRRGGSEFGARAARGGRNRPSAARAAARVP